MEYPFESGCFACPASLLYAVLWGADPVCARCYADGGCRGLSFEVCADVNGLYYALSVDIVVGVAPRWPCGNDVGQYPTPTNSSDVDADSVLCVVHIGYGYQPDVRLGASIYGWRIIVRVISIDSHLVVEDKLALDFGRWCRGVGAVLDFDGRFRCRVGVCGSGAVRRSIGLGSPAFGLTYSDADSGRIRNWLQLGDVEFTAGLSREKMPRD